VLVAAGGGGPMHAAALAAELLVKRLVVPPYSGVFSAWGMSLAAPRVDLVQTWIVRTSSVEPGAIDECLARLEDEAAAALLGQGVDPSVLRCDRSADIRYRGQEHAVRVPIAPGPVSLEAVERDFHGLHRQQYTFDLEGDPVELVTFHVTSRAEPAAPAGVPAPARAGPRTPVEKGRRRVDFDADGVHEAAVFERTELPAAFSAEGPMVVEEETTTTLVHPGQTLEVDAYGNLVVWL